MNGTRRPSTPDLARNPFAHWAARKFPVDALRRMLASSPNRELCKDWGLTRDDWTAALNIAIAFSEGW